jgi:hypothetical protein
MEIHKFSFCDKFVGSTFPQTISVYSLHGNPLLGARHPQQILGTSVGLLICTVQLHSTTSVTEPHPVPSRVSLTIHYLCSYNNHIKKNVCTFLSIMPDDQSTSPSCRVKLLTKTKWQLLQADNLKGVWHYNVTFEELDRVCKTAAQLWPCTVKVHGENTN